MKKLIMSTMLAGSTTFSLFVFMAFLISSDKVVVTTPTENVPIVVGTLPEEKPPTVKPPVILKPPVTPPPMPSPVEMPEVTGEPGTPVYNPPPLVSTGGDIKQFTYGGDASRDATPVVRVSPKYPMDAVRDGIEGWVVLAFDISPIGEVINVSVVDSQPKRIFDRAARQALRKWKYRAKKADGVAVSQENLTVQLDFTMAQQS